MTATEAGHNPTKLQKEIITKLCRYIDGVITLKEFGDWFVPITWTVTAKDEYLNKLVYSIKICFAEYSNGHWTREDLRERLIDIIL